MNIAPKSLNFKELVKTSNTTLSLNIQDRLVERLNTDFTDDEQRWYVANLYMYMNYHPIADHPINLEHVFNMIGFANKGNAMKTIKSNFTEGEDYKTVFFRIEKNPNIKNLGGRPREKIMLNVDTFKNLCMLAKTDRGKSIRRYYVKLENVYNEFIKQEINEQKQITENQQQKLIEQQQRIELLEHKPNTHGFNSRRAGYVYMINDRSKPGHYKIGMSYDVDKRLSKLNTASSEATLRVFHEVKTYDCETLENIIHKILQPFNIPRRREWFFFSNDTELQYALQILHETQAFLNKFDFKSSNDIIAYVTNNANNKPIQVNKQQTESQQIELQQTEPQQTEPQQTEPQQTEPQQDFIETNVYKLSGQNLKNKTGIYKGVFWCTEKSKWRAALKIHYKECFLGYFDTELQGAIVYNDYALFLNNTLKTSYSINDIPEYTPNPRDIVKENLENEELELSSKYNGVSYDRNRKHYVVSIKYKRKSYHLGNSNNELECAKLYNQQALYFNKEYNTNYILNDIPDYITIPKNIHEEIQSIKINKKSTQYYGVTFCKSKNKFRSVLVYNKKQIHLGFFENELDAAKAYNLRAEELNKENKHKYTYNLNI